MNYIFQFQQLLPYTDELLEGAWLTLTLSFNAMLIGLALGVAGAMGRLHGPKALRFLIACWVEIFRNTPLLVQAFLIFFGLPAFGIRLSPDLAALIALSLNAGAYLTEIVRGGFLSLPRGQIEAASALGLGRFDRFRDVMLLPALRAVFPAVTSEFLIILLGSSVCSIISTHELTSVAGTIEAKTFRSFEVYIVLLFIYLAMTLVFSVLFGAVRRRVLSWRI